MFLSIIRRASSSLAAAHVGALRAFSLWPARERTPSSVITRHPPGCSCGKCPPIEDAP